MHTPCATDLLPPLGDSAALLNARFLHVLEHLAYFLHNLLWSMFRAPIGSENEDGSKKFVIRPYTPTSLKDAKGYFDLVVKVYEEGKMSKHFGDMKVRAAQSTSNVNGQYAMLLLCNVIHQQRKQRQFPCLQLCPLMYCLLLLQEGDTLECKGPIPKFNYKPNMKKSIGMVSIPCIPCFFGCSW